MIDGETEGFAGGVNSQYISFLFDSAYAFRGEIRSFGGCFFR
jgi:hypothetical protein